MPKTPSVDFNFQNNNVQASTPSLGISKVVARTTKGPFNQPDTVINSYTKFQEIYGEEIVPDGSVSNIKKAFEIGSKLRISRVAGKNSPSKGTAKSFTPGEEEPGEVQVINMILVNPANEEDKITIPLSFRTKEAGSPILDNTGYGLDRNFYLRVALQSAPTNRYYLTQFTEFSGADNDQVSNVNILANTLMFSASKPDDKNLTPFIEAQVFADFLNQVPNIEVYINGSVTATKPEVAGRIKTSEDIVSVLKSRTNWKGTLNIQTTPITAATYMIINEGTDGGESDADTWYAAYEATKAYSDAYQLILSHIHQHLKEDYTGVYQKVATEVIKDFEEVLYVEVPKYASDGTTVLEGDALVKFLETFVPSIGFSKNIAYFGGGIKYYDENGSLQNSDVLGSIIGLGDVSATQYAPWFSFSGMNRGILANAVGPVMKNYGGPAYKDFLQSLADWYMNLIVIKDTRFYGKRTMLWHGFTSNPKSDSEKFLSIVRLNLYLKKNLRPIFESYIEEPNYWETWKKIYYEAKDVLDDIVDRSGMTEYTWMGDQDAQNYEDLQINNEADVRQGIYKVRLEYKDIVGLQHVIADIVINSASREIDFSTSVENV